MRKTRSKKLALAKDTVRRLDQSALARAQGGALTWTTIVMPITVSFQYCGSRNGCATLSGDGCGDNCDGSFGC